MTERKPNLFDALQDLGHPVVFYPSLNAVTGGVAETVFLSQLNYWEPRTDDAGRWIRKSQLEIEAETGLTRREQITARKVLKERGILEEKKAGVPSTLHFRINRERLSSMWDDARGTRELGDHVQTGTRETRELDRAPRANLPTQGVQTTKGTETKESKEHKNLGGDETSRDLVAPGASWNAGQVLGEVIKPGEVILVDLKARFGRELRRIAESSDDVSFEIVCQATRRCLDETKTPTALPLIVQELIRGGRSRSGNGHQPWRAPEPAAYGGEIR